MFQRRHQKPSIPGFCHELELSLNLEIGASFFRQLCKYAQRGFAVSPSLGDLLRVNRTFQLIADHMADRDCADRWH